MNTHVRRARAYPAVAIVMLILSMLGALVNTPLSASAQTGSLGAKPANPDPSNARTQSIFVKTVTPGQTVEDAVTVTNNADTAQTIAVYATDSVVSSGGAFACAQLADTPTDVGKWMTLSRTSLELAAHSTETVAFTMTVPADAEPGEHNGCIALQEQTTDSTQAGISLSFRTAIRVAILIPGDIRKTIEASGLRVDETDSRIIVTPVIQNTGNVSADATTTVSLMSVFGFAVANQSSIYPVLSKQTTEVNGEFEKPFWGGVYFATYAVSYDKSNNFLGETSDPEVVEVFGPRQAVFVTPHPLAFIVEFGVLAGISVGIWFLVGYLRFRRMIKKTWTTYKVKRGDDIESIAIDRDILWTRLARINKLRAPYTLDDGQTLRVPPVVKLNLKPTVKPQKKPKTSSHGSA